MASSAVIRFRDGVELEVTIDEGGASYRVSSPKGVVPLQTDAGSWKGMASLIRVMVESYGEQDYEDEYDGDADDDMGHIVSPAPIPGKPTPVPLERAPESDPVHTPPPVAAPEAAPASSPVAEVAPEAAHEACDNDDETAR